MSKDGAKIGCHRDILCTISPYFVMVLRQKAHFEQSLSVLILPFRSQERKKSEQLHLDLARAQMRALLEYAYNGHVRLTVLNASSIHYVRHPQWHHVAHYRRYHRRPTCTAWRVWQERASSSSGSTTVTRHATRKCGQSPAWALSKSSR